MSIDPLPSSVLPPGVRARFVANVNGLRMHVLEAGYDQPDRPMLLLLHGFPELAYSWRKIMLPLAAAGYYVVAPDQRGYGHTTGWNADYDGDLELFRMTNLAADAMALVSALGRRSIAAVIGHDFGSPVAGWCALMRPDVFPRVAMMSAPFTGAPALPFATDGAPTAAPPAYDIHAALAALPRPRKHYIWYYGTRPANADMLNAPQGVHALLRAYYHVKSADWAENKPAPLGGWRAEELAKLPTYYVMDHAADMAATVAPNMPSTDEIAKCAWLTEAEMAVYALEYTRTGFQGGLNWYRGQTEGRDRAGVLFSGRTIDVPACFISGAQDWGTYQTPGALGVMEKRVCTQWRGTTLIDGAGHWVQQEQAAATVEALLSFLR